MVQDVAFVVDPQQVAFVDEIEVDAERIDPEGGRVDWITDSDVASEAFVETVVAEDAVGSC